jgi:glycosyltransferase involved in cell wall biosynthesis
MRVAIGAILGTLGGPATYARELIHALGGLDAPNDYVIITDRPDLLDVRGPNMRCVRAPLPSVLLQPLWDHGWVPYCVRRYRADVYHGTKGMLPVWMSCPAVVTIHDLAVYHQPETFALLQRVHQRMHTPLAVRRAARVIADSEHARQDLLQRFALRPDQVVAIPLAAAPIFSARPGTDDERIAEELNLPARYLLYAGTIQPRKNVEALVAAFGAMRKAAGVVLLIAGRVRPGYQPQFLTRAPEGVRYIGPVTDKVLAVLYRRALAMCSPSSFEGFGLSLLEAMASGCLVIAAANSAVEDLVNGCGILVSGVSAEAIRPALERTLSTDGELDGMRARAQERAARYSWRDTACRTLAVYCEAVQHACPGV